MDDAHSERGPRRVRPSAARRHRRPARADIEYRTGIETRSTTLGHIQRGGTPTAYDRVLATRYGMAAVDSVLDGAWGSMVALRGTEIVNVPFEDALGKLNTVRRTATTRPRSSSADSMSSCPRSASATSCANGRG